MADAFATRVMPTLTKMQERRLSLNAMAAGLTSRGIRMARDGGWTSTTVRQLLDRA